MVTKSQTRARKSGTRSSTPSNGRRKRSATSQNGRIRSSNDENTLQKAFERELKDIYNAEQQLVKALPEMAEAAENQELQELFNDHLEVTRRQVERLEKIFSHLRIQNEDEERCEGMEGILDEGKRLIRELEESPVRDAALIIAGQKVEHYEIASYGSLRELADVLGYPRIADLLERSLSEEKNTDQMLSEVANEINDEAYEQSSEELEEAESLTWS